MTNTTNMSMVKMYANQLLKLPPVKTEYSPMIVSHPFTNSGILGMPMDDDYKFINIVDSADGLKLWQEQVKSQIMSAKNVMEICYMMNSAYLLTFLDSVKEHLSRHDYAHALSYSWVKEESPNKDPNVSKTKLIKMFKMADKDMLMSDSEREVYDDMPSSVRVYRGVGRGKGAGSPNALSWTLSRDKAEWFAHRYGDGRVYSATIDKKHVLAYFGDSGESEVVVDYKYLQDVTEISMDEEYMVSDK